MTDDYEKALLGAILRGYADIPTLAQIVSGSDFHQPAHEQIWHAITAVHADGHKIEPMRVMHQMGAAAHRLPGGATYLTELDSPIGADAAFYAEKVREQSIRRSVALLGDRCRQAETDPDIDTDDLLARVRSWLDEIATVKTGHVSDISAALQQVIEVAEHGETRGVPTPWKDLNDLVDGVHPGQLMTFAARPGGGKSIALENFATTVARSGRWAHMASMEMSPKELTQRTMAWTARVNLSKIRAGAGRLSEVEWQAIAQAASAVESARIRFSDASSQSVASIRAEAWETAQHAKRQGESLGIVAVDYVQLIRGSSRRGYTRQQELGEICRGLKALARELEVPVIMGAQLRRHEGTPGLNDLREAGDIEQDSDIVVLMHPETVEDQGRTMNTGEMDWIVAKNRNGPLGSRPAVLNGYYARIHDRNAA